MPDLVEGLYNIKKYCRSVKFLFQRIGNGIGYDLPNGNFCINDFTVFGVNGLGESVIGSGLSKKLSILFSMEGIVESFGLKT